MSSTLSLCDTIGSGWLFPVTQFEVDLPDVIRIILYGVLLVYFFLGVAMISDIFMSSIDEITSRRTQTLCGNYVHTPKVWNATVATLSLMALGSSAPEIFLAVVEIFKKEFHIGPLGTSTIVGSAAFNLLVIISVCMVVIPTGENRKIQDLPAFYITAVFSLFAYVWLAFIVSDERVTWWESLLTLLFLPLLIFVSYKADIGAFDGLWTRSHVGPPEPKASQTVAPTLIGFKPQSGHKMKNEYVIHQTKDSQKLEITVTCLGEMQEATCQYKCEKLTAVPAYHFVETDGELQFSSNMLEQKITVDICGGCTTVNRAFVIVLSEPWRAQFQQYGNGGNDECILVVTILPPKTQETAVLGHMVEARVGSSFGVRRVIDEWKEQLSEAVYCGGSPSEQSDASWSDFFAHLIAMPWKIIFSCAPPVYLGHGWARFAWSLFGIACMTMMISDLAELFGCVLDIPDICTALVFVALGTSMPDLFASLSAAKEDPTADASIVNVTGSNSVNVFLGVGVPYLIAAIRWEAQGGEFIVKTDGLVFSIISFCLVCIGALVLLHARRQLVGAELGGPSVPKWVCGVVFLCFWVAFVGISSWRVLRARGDGVTGSEELMALLALGASVVLITSMTTGFLFKYRVPNQPLEDEVGKEQLDAPMERKTSPQGSSSPKGCGSPRTGKDGDRPLAGPTPLLLKALSRSMSGLTDGSAKSEKSGISGKSAGSSNSSLLNKSSARKHARNRCRPHPVIVSKHVEEDGEQRNNSPVLLRALSTSGSFTSVQNAKEDKKEPDGQISIMVGPDPTAFGNDQGDKAQEAEFQEWEV